ncbi:uncharacterized protein N7515_006376 [Penicillium bovifimosum]|uniref:Uncharacterized protein n=1 Tax=Penicillium bovifimosum TaxID=126998 RepID=A0A9W9L149_9EURO|nr:uncharacterized protein N7515_006376 [Penicillium bovifimosum]KAJ5130337.1 hypothetical protein N7515_006376 [Penicillium bovifimosum]
MSASDSCANTTTAATSIATGLAASQRTLWTTVTATAASDIHIELDEAYWVNAVDSITSYRKYTVTG